MEDHNLYYSLDDVVVEEHHKPHQKKNFLKVESNNDILLNKYQ